VATARFIRAMLEKSFIRKCLTHVSAKLQARKLQLI
jgi:hypothetical protein